MSIQIKCYQCGDELEITWDGNFIVAEHCTRCFNNRLASGFEGGRDEKKLQDDIYAKYYTLLDFVIACAKHEYTDATERNTMVDGAISEAAHEILTRIGEEHRLK